MPKPNYQQGIVNNQPEVVKPNQSVYSNKNPYQQNVAQPVQQNTKWYKGDQPTFGEAVGRIWQISQEDPERGKKLQSDFQARMQDPTSRYFRAYSKPTNQAVTELANLGVDASQMNAEWFRNNTDWQQNLLYNGTTNTPSKPPKRGSTAEQWKSYWTYQIFKSEEDTQNAERELAALKQEISYKAANPNRNDSDDEIIASIDWKKYPTLAKMEATKGVNPVELNRAVNFNMDDLYGVMWNARNGKQDGNLFNAIAHNALGEGNVWQEDPALRAKLNWNNKATYAPYSAGPTVDQDVLMYFGVYGIDQNTLDQLRATIDQNDETSMEMFNRASKAFETTQKAEAELDDLYGKVNNWLKSGKSEEFILKQVDKLLKRNDYSTLRSMDESIENGSKLLETTRAIDYRKQDFIQKIKDSFAVGKTSAADLASNGLNKSTGTDINVRAAREMDEYTRDASSVFDDDATPAESAAFSGYSGSQDAATAELTNIKENASNPDVEVKAPAMDDILDKQTGEVKKGYIEETSGVYKRINDYENTQKTLDEAMMTADALRKALGAKEFYGQKNDLTYEQEIDGQLYKITMAPDLSGVASIDAVVDVAGMDEQTFPVYDVGDDSLIWEAVRGSDELSAHEESYQLKAKKIAEADSMEITEQDEQMLQALRQADMRIEDAKKALREGQDQYDKDVAAYQATMDRWNAHIQNLRDSGKDTFEMEVATAVMQEMSSFTDYEATVWDQYNPTYAYEEAIASGENRDEVLARAEAEYKEAAECIKDIEWMQNYLAENKINVPADVKQNMERRLAKHKRDMEDYEFFRLQFDNDFNAVAEAGMKAEYDARQRKSFLGASLPFDNVSEEEYYSMMASGALDKDFYSSGSLMQASGGIASLMTDNERKTWYYLNEKDKENGTNKAQDYLNFLTDGTYGVMTVRKRMATEETAREWTESGALGFVTANVAAIALSPYNAIASGAYRAYTALTGEELNPNSYFFAASHFRNTTREQSAEEIKKQAHEWANGNEKTEEVLQQILQGGYEILTNRADSAMNAAAFGWMFSGVGNEMLQEFLGAAPMGISAAMEAAARAKDQGASDTQAYAVATYTFFAETGTEAISLDNMKSALKIGEEMTADTFKKFALKWLTQAGISEAFGESLNDIIENYADEKIMGQLSEHAKLVEQYRLAGNKPEDAEALARRDEINGVLRTALISYLSPGLDVFQTAKGRYNYYKGKTIEWNQNNPDNKKTFRQIRSGELQQMREARETDRQQQEEWKSRPVEEMGEIDYNALGEKTGYNMTAESQRQEQLAMKKKQAESNAVDFEILETAKTGDRSAQNAAISAVLTTEQTEEAKDISDATAGMIHDVLGEERNATEEVQDLLVGASVTNADIPQETIKQGLTYAALGGDESACRQVMQSDEYQKATPAVKASMLADAVQTDQQNQNLAGNIQQTVHDYRVAKVEGRIISEGATKTIEAAEAKSIEAEGVILDAQNTLDKQRAVEQAAFQAAQQAGLYSDANTHQAKLNEALKQVEIRKSYERALEAAQRKEQATKANEQKLKQQVKSQIRQQAEAEVSQQDQQRQQAAEQQRIAEEQAAEQERQAKLEEDRRTGKLQEDQRRALIDQQVEKLNLKGEAAENVRNQLYQFDQDLTIGKADTSKLLTDVDSALALNAISRKLGVQIEVGELPAGKDGRYSNGRIVLSNRLTVGQALVEVALHEITHSLEKTKSYGKYKNAVMGILFSTPEAREKAIQDKINFYESNGVNLGNTPAQKRAAAEAEIVADFAKDSKTFANKQTIQRMMDAGLGGRIRNALHNVNQYLRNMKLTGEEKVRAEGLRRAERLYQKALNERAAVSAHPNADQFSVNQFAEAAGLYYQETNLTDKDGNIIAKAGLYTADPNTDQGAKRLDKVTPEMIADTPVGKLTNAALALGTMDHETVGKIHKMFADLMTMCTDLQDTNIVWEIAGSTLYSEFSAIKANSDKQYSNTVDFGTICTKTQAVVNQLSKNMLRLGRGLTSQEILQVYNDVYEADLKVPCPVCYVFSRWLGVPSLLENIRQYQNRFLGEPGTEFNKAEVQKRVDEFIKNAHIEYGIGKTEKELETYKENVQKALKNAQASLQKTEQKIADVQAKIAGYEDMLKQNPTRRDWLNWKAAAEKNLAALQEELANRKAAVDNVEVEAYAKTINKKKAEIEKKIKDKTIKIEGSDKGERGINDDIRDRIKEGKSYDDLEKKRDKLYEEIDGLYEKLREVDAYNWVTQALCKMDRKGNFVIDDEFVRTKDEILLDLNRTGEFAKDVKNWTYRSTRGAGMGKAILPYSGASIGDSVLGTAARSVANPFKDHDNESGAIAALKSSIMKAKRQNLIGGQRFQSTSDFRPEWGLDYIMTFIEQQALGSNGQLYTKVNEAVPLYASAGIDTNCSIMPYADGFHFPAKGEVEKMSEQEKKSRVITFKDDTGKDMTVVLDFSDVTGMPYEYAQPLSKAYDSVQMIMVGINDIHIRACLAGEEIDFVIPWHSSGNTKGQLQSMMKTVNETLTNSSDYTKVQTDQIADKKALETAHGKVDRGEDLTDHERDLIHKEQMRDARERLITGKTLTATDIERISESSFLTGLYERFMGKTLDGKELPHDPKYWVSLPDGKGGTVEERVTLTSGQAEQIFPYEYWDTSLTKDQADENGWRFVEYCQELGLVPRFSGGNQKNDEDGSITRFGNFSGAVYDAEGNITGYNRDNMAKGYWKTLIDRKMYDNSGNYRDQQQIDASKVQVGRLERADNGKLSLEGSNIPESTEGANYRGDEAREKYQKASESFRQRIEQKAAKGDKQAIEDLKHMQAYDDAHADDIEQYDLAGDINPDFEMTEGEMLQMLKDAGIDYQDALNRGDTVAAQEDADFINSYSSYPDDVDITKPNAINPNYTDHDGDPVTNDAVEKSDVNVQYSLRTIAPPKETKKCFKAFYVKDGKLYPPMVSNNTNEEDIQKGTKLTSGTMRGLETPVGVWLDADVGGLAVDENGEPIRTSTTGRLRVKNDKGGDSLAFRPGWHLGEWPDATQFYKTDPVTGKKKSVMPDDLVFAECEIAADVDYQIEALELGVSEKGKFNRTQAGLPRVPVDGYYKYRTNANPSEAPWYITGAMKVTRILTDEECRQECAKHGVQPAERYSHHDINLEEYGLKAGEVTPTENLERFAKNQASYDNDALLDRALNDERYQDAYKRRTLNFDDPTIRNEFIIDRIDDEQFEKYRREYQAPDAQWYVNDSDMSNLTEGEMLQILNDAGTLSQKDAARYSLSADNIDRTLVEGGIVTSDDLKRLNRSDRGEGQRQFNTQTAQRSDVFKQEALDYLKAHNHYVQDTNNAELARAIAWIGKNATDDDPSGYQNSLKKAIDGSFDYKTKDGQARMIALMGMAAAKGNTHDQVLLLRDYGKQGTTIAQALQARKMFNLMTPEGRMLAMDKMLQNAQEGINTRSNIQLEFSEWVYKAAAAAATEEDFDRVRQAAMTELGKQIPATWKDRVRSLRMLAMLANPRTHIRNILGNMFFMPAVSIKNKLAAVMELGVEKGNRTKTLAVRVNSDIRNFSKEVAQANKRLLTGEAKYNEAVQLVKAQTKMGGFLDAISDLNSKALEGEDWMFLKGHFTRSFGGWMQANGYTVDQVKNDAELMEKGITYAVNEAQKATYRDFNQLASTLNEVSRKGGVAGFLVDAALPFKKTPANILRRGLEYSPVGIVKSLTADMIHMKQYLDYQNGKINALPEKAMSPTQVIDDICSGLAGTAITAMGFLLAGSGIVTCGLDDDEDKLDKAEGVQEYAIRMKLFGQDVTFTMDWAAPMSMPFFVGAAIRNQMEQEGEVDVEKVLNAMGGITEPVFNLSMLDGINTLFKTSSYDETNPITQILSKLGTNYVSSYVPSILGAIARTIDDKQRKAFVEQGKGKGVMGNVRYMIEQAQNKIPGLNQQNIAVRDIWGEEKTTGFVERLLENFILPGYIEKVEDDPIINEMGRLYDSTGDAGMIPKEDPDKSITVDKEKRVLTDKQWDHFKEVRNKTAKKELTELINSASYKNATDAVQVQMIKEVWNHADKVGRNAVFPDYEVEAKNIEEIAKDGKVAGYKTEIIKALDAEDYDAYDTMVEAIRAEYDDEKDADAVIRKKIGDTYRPQWQKAYRAGDEAKMVEIENILEYTDFDFNIYGTDGWQDKIDEKYNQ